jgi:hypothetical protein
MNYTTTTSDWAIVSTQSNVTFQVRGVIPIEIGISTNETAPVSGILYAPLEGDRGPIYDIWPGVSGNCVWARSAANSVLSVTQT